MNKLKVALSTIGKFHTFDLARALFRHDSLAGIYTGYPRFKLKNEGVPAPLIHTFPYLHAPYMGFRWRHLLAIKVQREWEYWDRVSFDRHVAKNIVPCDVFSGLSGSALITGRVVKRRGGIYVCDRGSCHIRMQDRLLREEHARWGLPYRAIDPRIIAREEDEYDLSDAITIPSGFVYRSFVECGISPEKLRVVPYGVNLERFHKVADPDPTRFDVLSVCALSLRKGVPDLLKAFSMVTHKNKTLTLAGNYDPAFVAWLGKMNLLSDKVIILGHVPQQKLKQVMSRSHVLVLASIEEGLSMVLAQAMACGCPVVATANTGAQDLFTDGKEGFICPARDDRMLADRLQQLADSPDLQGRMSAASLLKVTGIGGWHQYGLSMISAFQDQLVRAG